jgi:hypothetical protein
MIVTVLRNRKKELFIALLLIIPIIILTMTEFEDNNVFDLYLGSELAEIISYLIIPFPLFFIVILGISDAANIESINHKGSLWLVMCIIASVVFGFSYYIFKLIETAFPTLITDITVFEGLYWTAGYIMVGAIAIILVISILVALSKKLKTKRIKLPREKSDSTNVIVIFFISLINKGIAIFQALIIAGYFIYQFIAIIGIELFHLALNTIQRLYLIAARLSRAAIIIIITALFTVMASYIAKYVDEIWRSNTFNCLSDSQWIEFFVSLLCFVLLFYTLELLLYSKWKKISDTKMTYQNFLESTTGIRQNFLEIRSIGVSLLIYLFLILISLWLAWTLIGGLYLVTDKALTKFGVIYVVPTSVCIIITVIYVLTRRKNETREDL